MAKILSEQILRRITFRPYLDKREPVFHLVVWDTWRTRAGKSMLGYRLGYLGGKVIFRGEDFGCPPGCDMDGRRMVCSLMGFLCLRPGDTDREYFQDYTHRQLTFCSEHAEPLLACCEERFGPR